MFLIISGGQFNSNVASSSGGAIYIGKTIIYENISFWNNSAIYGNDIACYASHLGLVVVSSSNESNIIYNSMIQNQSTFFKIYDQMPGDTINISLIFYALDYLNQTVYTQDTG